MNELGWFERLFPIGMILIPLLTSLGAPSEYTTPAQRGAIARLRLWLVLATAACVAVVVALWWLAPEISMFSWMLVFVLSPVSMRIINLRHPEVAMAHQRQRRTATLAPRDLALTPTARLIHSAAWILWLALFAATLVVMADRGWRQAWLLGLHAFALFWLIWSGLFGRRTMLEAEPLPESPGPELIRAYQRFRTGRQLLWIVIGVGAMLAFALPSLVLALDPERYLTLAIILGAGGGAAGGVAGGLFGTWADRQRVALAQQVLEQAES